MKVRSRQYSGRSLSSSSASAFLRNRAHVAASRPAQTSDVSLRRSEIRNGDASPSGAIRS